ncbi:DNA-binding protein [Myceligenerans indicum]|uniref:DNA-binding protein n=1 Tax=Myceligenerans indicum TaxID=2593663 RepID=A0ABS1LKQ0_9MICO|nr:DNA-binding protein [Myceligenerans indicum]MBL0886830.1 DNA-binding protein [Myceligenerans indicum]
MTRFTAPGVATLVLDSEGLSRWIERDRRTAALIEAARRAGARLVISANTVLEVAHPKVDRPRLRWLLSQVKVEPVSQDGAHKASALLIRAGMHGHQHALDATVVEAALRQTHPVVVLTSDPGDIDRLSDHQVRTIPV